MVRNLNAKTLSFFFLGFANRVRRETLPGFFFENSRGINLCRIFRCGQICRIRKKLIDDSDSESNLFSVGKNHNQTINSKLLEPLHNSVHYRTYTPLEGSFRKPQKPNLGVALLVIRLTFLVATSLELLPFHHHPSKDLFPRLEIRFPKTHYIYMGCYNLNECMCVLKFEQWVVCGFS